MDKFPQTVEIGDGLGSSPVCSFPKSQSENELWLGPRRFFLSDLASMVGRLVVESSFGRSSAR